MAGPSSMLLLLIATLACSVLGEDDCPANNFVPGGGCKPDPNICQLTCKKNEDCVLTAECAKALVVDTPAHDAMNPTKCEELCAKSDAASGAEEEPRCRFWRYEQGLSQERICSLMKQDGQCNIYQHCPPSATPEEGCATGDVGCPGGLTPPTPTQPASLPCKSGIEFKPEPTSAHWSCTDSESPYDPDVSTMPASTLCFTVSRCADWTGGVITDDKPYYRKLRVTCDGATGKWKQEAAGDGEEVDYTGDTGVLSADGSDAIKEHVCLGGAADGFSAPLVVPLGDDGIGHGGELACETDDTDSDDATFTIAHPNTCVLLCDYHLGMTIESSFSSETGEYVFLDQDANPVIDGTTIKCWGYKQN